MSHSDELSPPGSGMEGLLRDVETLEPTHIDCPSCGYGDEDELDPMTRAYRREPGLLTTNSGTRWCPRCRYEEPHS